MSKLDLLLKDFYQGESLPQQQLDAIKQSSMHNQDVDITKKSTQTGNDLTPSFHQQRKRFSGLQQCAAALVITLSLLSVTTYYLNTKHQKHQLLDEIALNHHKQFKADVINSNFITIGNELSGANFNIDIPEHIQDQYHLLGARYCSIAKQLAVHLKLLDKRTAKTSSLFITPTTAQFKNIQNDTDLTKQHHAHFWSHNSLFYALLSEDKF